MYFIVYARSPSQEFSSNRISSGNKNENWPHSPWRSDWRSPWTAPSKSINLLSISNYKLDDEILSNFIEVRIDDNDAYVWIKNNELILKTSKEVATILISYIDKPIKELSKADIKLYNEIIKFINYGGDFD